MASAVSDQETSEGGVTVVSLRNVTEVELQRRIQECVVKDQVTATVDREKRENDIRNENHSGIVANFQAKIVDILVVDKGIDKIHLNDLNDVWGVVIDPSQVQLSDEGLYRKITVEVGEYEIKKTFKETTVNDWNEVFQVKDVKTGLEHIMKTTPLQYFSEHKELQCMLDSRIENLRPKLYAIYLKYPSVYLHMEFLRSSVSMDKFMLELMPRIHQEMAIPYVFHIWFIAACLENIKIIRSCHIAHNDLTEGNIMIVLDQSIKVMFIDFEIASTWEGAQPNEDDDINDIRELVQNYFKNGLMNFIGQNELSTPVSSRILHILRAIGEATNNIEDDLMEDLRWVLNQIDESGQQRRLLFRIIHEHVYNEFLEPVMDLRNRRTE